MAYFVYGLFNLLMVVLTSANFLMALDEAVLAWVVDAAIIFFEYAPRSGRSTIYWLLFLSIAK